MHKAFGNLVVALAEREPTIRKDLPEIIAEASRYNLVGIVTNGTLITPEKAEEYETDEQLDNEILDFIGKWLDIPDDIKQFALWNIKRSWVYEKFNTLNYLRALGDTGVGKTLVTGLLAHYFIGKGKRIVSVEHFQDKMGMHEVKGRYAHTNHFILKKFIKFSRAYPDTTSRLKRINQLLPNCKVQDILNDRQNKMYPLLRQGERGYRTLSQVIFDAREGKVRVHDRKLWKEFKL